MSPLWLITVAAWLVAAPLLTVLAIRAVREMKAIHGEVRRFDELRPALVEVRTEADEIRRRLALRAVARRRH